MQSWRHGRRLFLILAVIVLPCWLRPASANIAGGGTGSGSDVTVTDNGDTVTMANGIASIVIVKKTGRLNSVAYTHDNGGATETSETLSGKGQYYYGGLSLGNGIFEYSLATNPVSNGGNLADAKLLSSTETKGVSLGA
jgi:hypothetical protein